MAENTKQFFQITEAARACGLSRSTLMRREERGLLTPVFTAPDSGRRYYDNHNVARIMQIEKFKAMGLGSKEIADYFAQGGEAEVTLEACRVLSVLYYGDYSGVGEAWLTLGREVKARGLKPAGAPRVLGIVAPYTGREIETRRYCSRLALPVEEYWEAGGLLCWSPASVIPICEETNRRITGSGTRRRWRPGR